MKKLVKSVLDDGDCTLIIGQHNSQFHGFWAKVVPDSEWRYFDPELSWEDTGHGFTLSEAIMDAWRMYKVPNPQPIPPEVFSV
jgi:hypothetical protein